MFEKQQNNFFERKKINKLELPLVDIIDFCYHEIYI